MSTISYLFRSLRPEQWIKNGFILLPLLFSQKVFHYPSLVKSLAGFVIFCILSGAVYLLNDLFDLEADRKHPVKRHRPLAAGLISPRFAKVTTTALLLSSLVWGAYLGRGFFLVLITYLTIQLLYNYRLKAVVILDVFCVAFGFFLRVVAGAVVIQVWISHWLVICSILVSMFLALAKRRHELVILGDSEAGNHRRVLTQYSPYLLDQMIGITTASTLLSYMLYCISSETIQRFQTDHMIYTFPFVLYGIFRYFYLIYKKNQGGSPEKLLVSDLPLFLSVLLWGVACAMVIYGIV